MTDLHFDMVQLVHILCKQQHFKDSTVWEQFEEDSNFEKPILTLEGEKYSVLREGILSRKKLTSRDLGQTRFYLHILPILYIRI